MGAGAIQDLFFEFFIIARARSASSITKNEKNKSILQPHPCVNIFIAFTQCQIHKIIKLTTNKVCKSSFFIFSSNTLFNSTAFSMVCISTASLLFSAHRRYVLTHIEVAFDVCLFCCLVCKNRRLNFPSLLFTYTYTNILF